MVSGRNPSLCSTCVYTGTPEVTEVLFSVALKQFSFWILNSTHQWEGYPTFTELTYFVKFLGMTW